MKALARLGLAALAAAALTGCRDTGPTTPQCAQLQVENVPGDTVTTDSGLRFIVFEEGEGEPIEGNQFATVHYVGFLENGILFDSSVGGQPVTFNLAGNLIPGFAEGVTGMRVGEARRMIIPPNLAYGNQSPHPCIPANSTLIFDTWLVGIGS
jgi:FKBP-type peptidyl-prolyl cis-trans isomerase